MLAHYLHDLSPFLFQLPNGWGLRYYGLSYVLGFLFLYFGLRWHLRRGWLRLPAGEIDTVVFWLAFGGAVLGGRLGYVLFYDLLATLHDPLRVFRVWEGGMSSHGGIIGVIVVMLCLARRYRIPFYQLADAAAWCTPVGLGLGRVANFINGELWGRPSELPWAVIFPTGGMIPRHPSQLYEALLEGAVLFAILHFTRLRARREGAVALMFVGAYGALRIVGECFREPDPQIGYYFGVFTQGQLLSFGLILLALGLNLKRRAA
jgi:phosphatidylglycerol---prolipoprotein diacylglyceryl transferase